MTFIIAIQLNDSIIVTSDRKEIVINETTAIQFKNKPICKINAWDKGIITGTGELTVIQRSIKLFKTVAQSDLTKLPICLDISRKIRELEIGIGYFQVKNTKLLCSCYSENGAQLYKIERFSSDQPYELIAIEAMDITIWLFHPNIEAISSDLQNLYTDLKDYSVFSNKTEWVNYYINQLASIYKKQNRIDPLMSQSFDIFFQNKNEYIFGHVANT